MGSVDSYSYVTADYSLICRGPDGLDSEWVTYAMVAVAAFLVYPLGIPLFYYYQLSTNKEALHNEDHPEHQHVHGKLAFLYQDYVPDAWYWELVLLIQKLMLTGVLVFIKPDSTSQLAVGFAVAVIFFVLHVRTGAYCEIKEYDLQFYATLSILTTLFGGILLKTDTQNEDAYGEVALTSLLIGCNTGIIFLFCYQIYLTWKDPPAKKKVFKGGLNEDCEEKHQGTETSRQQGMFSSGSGR